MNIAWRLVGILIGTSTLTTALIGFDLVRRADMALQTEEQRLHTDIARLRARSRLPAPPPGIDFTMPVLEDMSCPSSLWCGLKGRYPTYEEGHSGQRWYSNRAHHPGSQPNPRRFYVEELATALTLARVVYQEGGYDVAYQRNQTESGLLDLSPIPAGEGEAEVQDQPWFWSVLDLLSTTRLGAEEIILSQYILDRAELFRVWHRHGDPTAFIQARPDWRDLYSWRLFLLRILRTLENDYRDARVYCSTPPGEWQKIREGYYQRSDGDQA